jgi:hypothetical protein
MSNSSGITILAAEKQLDGQNWASFKDVMISLACGKGYKGYLNVMRVVEALPRWR